MSHLRLFIPIGKVDEVARTVYGTLTEEIADKSGEMFDYASGKPAVQAWSDEIKAASKGKSLGNVRAMHDSIAAGKFTDIVYDDDKKRIEGAAKIVDDGEWEKVLAGVYTGFSIGGSYTRRWQDPENPSLWRFTPKLSEISLVDNPCVPTATFEYIKADGSVEMRKFITPSPNEDSMEKLLADAREALAKGTATDEQKALATTADAELLKVAQDAMAKGDATDEQKALAKAGEAAPVLVKDGKAVKPKTAPVQKWLADDGEPFDTKREAEVHNLELEKKAELAPALAEMDALLKGAKKPADEDDQHAESDDEDTKKAKKARRDAKAKKDEDAEMAAKAAAADDLAKQEKATADKVAADVAAKAEGTGAERLTKGLYDIGWFANILGDIKSFTNQAEWEAMFEGDDSTLPGQLKAWLKQGAALLTAYVTEEASELAGDDDVEVLAMAAKMDSGHAAALAKHVKDGALKVELKKAGARHSKTDKESLMALHKSASDHLDGIEKCFKGMGIMADDGDDKDAKKMSKVIDQLNGARDEVSAVTKVAVSSNEALMKAIPVIECLQKQNAELIKRMEHLEGQPMPAKGHVRVISKAQDGGAATGETDAEYKARLAKLSPAEKSRELMKLAMSNPMDLPAL